MEHAAPVWHPFYNTDIYKLEKYREELLDGSHLTTPGIQVLRPYYPLLTYLHYNTDKIHPGYHCFTALLITYCQLTSPHTTKELNSIPETTHFILPHQASLNSFKYSFYPRTIRDWNNLPVDLIESRNLEEFTYLLNQL